MAVSPVTTGPGRWRAGVPGHGRRPSSTAAPRARRWTAPRRTSPEPGGPHRSREDVAGAGRASRRRGRADVARTGSASRRRAASRANRQSARRTAMPGRSRTFAPGSRSSTMARQTPVSCPTDSADSAGPVIAPPMKRRETVVTSYQFRRPRRSPPLRHVRVSAREDPRGKIRERRPLMADGVPGAAHAGRRGHGPAAPGTAPRPVRRAGPGGRAPGRARSAAQPARERGTRHADGEKTMGPSSLGNAPIGDN